jgi:hypothetical protein
MRGSSQDNGGSPKTAHVAALAVDARDPATRRHGGFIMKTSTFRIGLVFGATALIIGCGAPDLAETQNAEEGNDSQTEKGAEIGTTQAAVTNGWTPYTSEEYPPIVCDSANLMNSVQCSGSYCDNIRAYCQATAGTGGVSYWTAYFSEESTNYRYCNAGYWVTALACSGSHCDNNALQCTRITGITARNCYWTGWVSEEGGGLLSFGNQYYARGMQCSGSKCDNKRFYVCQP